MGIAFAIMVIASTVVVAAGSEASVWVVHTPLLPRAALPYGARRRARQVAH